MPEVIPGALSPVETVHYRQALMPYHMAGSFEGEDQDYHDFRFSARGKNVIGLFIDNPTDQTLTWELYGLHAPDSLPDGPGTAKVAENTILTTAYYNDYTHAYPFPFYLLRCYFGTAPGDDPAKDVSIWIDLQSGRLELPAEE